MAEFLTFQKRTSQFLLLRLWARYHRNICWISLYIWSILTQQECKCNLNVKIDLNKFDFTRNVEVPFFERRSLSVCSSSTTNTFVKHSLFLKMLIGIQYQYDITYSKCFSRSMICSFVQLTLRGLYWCYYNLCLCFDKDNKNLPRKALNRKQE